MKILKVFSFVIVLHMVMLVMLVLQPGCGTVDSKETAKASTPIGDSSSSGLWVMNEKDVGKNVDSRFMKQERVHLDTTVEPVSADTIYSEVHETVAVLDSEGGSESVYSQNNNYFEYKVERGDSLWKISRKHGISMKEVMAYNGLKESDRIFPGQTLMIPGEGPTNTDHLPVPEVEESIVVHTEVEAAPVEEASPEEAFNDTVVDFDTFQQQISDAPATVLDTEVNETQEQPEVVLASATGTEEGIYEVTPGDSLYIIAMRNNTSVSEIKKLNGLNKAVIRVGQKIKIPGQYFGPPTPVEEVAGSAQTEIAFNDTNEIAEDNRYLKHEVAPGEFPGLIARKYNMNVADLLHINDIRNPRMLRVGTTLKVVNPEYMVRQSTLATVEPEETESVVSQTETIDQEESEPMSGIDFEDFPIVRVGS